MDLRKKDRFFPFHSDLAARLSDRERGGRWIFDDLIIWDRRADYNNLRPLGYPAVFRINKVHEFLLIMRRPAAAPESPAKPPDRSRRAGTTRRKKGAAGQDDQAR
jgi:hypothetical protein